MAKTLQLDNGTVLTIKLETNDHAVNVTGTDQKGTKWYLVSFEQDGTLIRFVDIGESANLVLNNEGQIKQSKRVK